jgi:hypothetical protein
LKYAWHYTIGLRASKILADGTIMPATAGVPAHERPVVWFSTRQHWEPTATKGKIVNGVRSEMTLAEMIRDCCGLWRFGIQIRELLPWRELQTAAGITKETAQRLVRNGRKRGADPACWYGALDPVPVANCQIQRLDDDAERWLDAAGATGSLSQPQIR